MKKFLFALLHSTSAINLISWRNRKRVPILCYHSVVNDDDAVKSDPHKQHIALRLFLKHLDYLQSKYNVVSLAEFAKAKREKRRLPNYSAVLTFDDGFEDFYKVVAPHLSKRNLPATVFVITDRAASHYVPNGELFLNWDEIRELASRGVDIGSHTCSHPRLPDLSLEDVTRELRESHAALESNVGRSQIPLSYPFGQMSEPISRLAQSLGYSCAIANDCGPNSDATKLYELSRTVIASDDDIATFSARVSGLTWLITKLRRFLRSEQNDAWEPSAFAGYGSAAAESYD